MAIVVLDNNHTNGSFVSELDSHLFIILESFSSKRKETKNMMCLSEWSLEEWSSSMSQTLFKRSAERRCGIINTTQTA